ncbi:MAG: hypothetical protein RJA57_363 [Bacteroidota bacterium]
MISFQAILFLTIPLLLMGLFAGMETAYYHADRLALELRRKQGGRSIATVFRFLNAPDRFLGASLIGYHICLVMFCLQFGPSMHPLWEQLGIDRPALHIAAEIAGATVLILVFGDFIPRTLFRAHSGTLLIRMAWVTDLPYRVLAPVATALSDAAEWVLKYLFNVRLEPAKGPSGRWDLRPLFREQGTDQRDEQHSRLLENARELPKVRIRECLVPRKEVVGVDIRTSMSELQQQFTDTNLSKLIVYEGDIDHIRGYVHQLGLFRKPGQLTDILLPIPAVPESMSASDLIGKLTRERKSIAWVVDEYGGTAGIVTLEDVLEELFGEIQDEYDVEEFTEKRLSDNEFIFSGRIELDHLEKKYGFDFNEPESETLSGHIIRNHETIPRQKERIIIGDHEFEVLNASDTRIELVRMKKLK